MSKKKSRSHALQSLLPDSLETREIFFTNLLLLGFEPAEAERRHTIPFNRDMFALPNKKAFEVVMHFLFERLNPPMAHDKFRDCWPICDKKHEQAFRKTISNQLSEIAAEDPLANLPRIVPSLFMSPGGDRFYSLLLHFSQYVLMKVLKQENGKKEREILQRPRLLPAVSHLSHIMLKTIQVATIRHRRRFLDRAQRTVLLHREWKQFANELVKEHRNLTKQLRDLEHDIRDCQAASYDQAQARGSPVTRRRRSGGMTAGERQVQAVKRTQKIQKVRELWKAVDAFYVAQSAERDVVTSVLREVENKYRLDAGEINVQVPEMLLRECQQELQRRNVGNTYEGGKLNLLPLIQLWNMSLHLYLETIHQAPMPRFEDLSPDLVTQVHTHHAHLSNTQAMRSTLTNKLLPDLKASVDHLHKQIQGGKTPSRKDARRSFQHSSLGLALLPPTPPVSFEPASGSQTETPIKLSAGGTLKNNTSTDTPEAVSMLSDTINKAALKRAGLVQGTPTSTLGELRRQTQGTSKLPLPTGTVIPESMQNRKRVKSAPSKVAPSATPSTQTHPWHPNLSGTPHQGARAPSSTQRRRGVNGDLAKVPKTQPRKGAGSRLGRESKEGKKELKTVEKLSMHKASSKLKKSAAKVAAPSSVQRTPAGAPKPAAASSAMRSKTAPRAHQILAEEIADAVTSGGKITPDFLELLRTQSRENSPLDAALDNPLAGLDQDAFVSKDKLKRTPVSEASSLSTSQMTYTPHQTMPTRTLFDSDSSPKEPSVLNEVSPVDDDSLLSHELADGTPLRESQDLTSSVAVGNLLDLEEPEHLEGTVPPARNLLSGIDDAEASPGARLSYQELAAMGDDSSLPETRPEFSEDLEQTLAEIFQTRTPQLSIRSKTRIAARKHGASLFSWKEEYETKTSVPGTPSLASRKAGPAEGLTPDLNLLRQDRIRRQTESTRSHPEQEPVHVSQQGRSQADVSISKVRQVSGGSQKSVTFCDRVDEHSFLDQSLASLDQSNADTTSRQEYSLQGSPSDKPGSDESAQEPPGSAPRSKTPETPGHDASTFLSDVYLAHSPPPANRPSEALFMSPLEGQLLSDSDLGPDLSMNLSTAIDDLLVPISPDVTPSRTPKLTSRQLSANSTQPSAREKTPPSSHISEHPSFVESVPHLVDDIIGLKSGTSLIEDFSKLHLSRTAPVTPNHKSVETPMNFDLLDEDDSILLPTSPALRQGVLVDVSSPSP
ncbi:uncharacterized protein LOC110989705 [Acanthaster planci]|uniref:Uncharacterized protein LOC110989705 n=1 Tax=Acanthaster planci TaxID=133434 RepID=A0A8B7ZWP9_ACAPL|nr:uncharacterized protein LOC110989705 [Acanthaster planci]